MPEYTVEQISEQRNASLITESEAREELDKQGIRGNWRDDGSFIGYDYRSQAWVDTGA